MSASRLALAAGVVVAFLFVLWKTQPSRVVITPAAPAVSPPPSAIATPRASLAIATPQALPPGPVREATPAPMENAPVVLGRTRSGVPIVAPSASAAAIESDLGEVQNMLRSFRDLLGENPIGTNAEIMQAILGKNRRQARIGAPEGQRLNESGELVDRWGTPYFFHQVSKEEMEIRSAGPDRMMWTGDDAQL